MSTGETNSSEHLRPRSRAQAIRRQAGALLVAGSVVVTSAVAITRVFDGQGGGDSTSRLERLAELGGEMQCVDGQAAYRARAGDTLWDISRALVGPNEDPRPLAADLVGQVGDLTAGEAVLIPKAFIPGCTPASEAKQLAITP